jgi:hypothetical protein
VRIGPWRNHSRREYPVSDVERIGGNRGACRAQRHQKASHTGEFHLTNPLELSALDSRLRIEVHRSKDISRTVNRC